MGLLGLPAGAWNLIGVFFGVIAGQGLTVWWDRRKQSAQRQEFRETTAESIIRELEEIAENIEQREGEGVPDIAYPDGAYRSSVSSGRFALLQTDYQVAVSELYGMIERAEEDQRQLREARLETEASRGYERQLQLQFNDRIDALEEQIPAVVTQLKQYHHDQQST